MHDEETLAIVALALDQLGRIVVLHDGLILDGTVLLADVTHRLVGDLEPLLRECVRLRARVDDLGTLGHLDLAGAPHGQAHALIETQLADPGLLAVLFS